MQVALGSSWPDTRPYWVLAAMLALAGAFQFGPLKQCGLTECRDPMTFLFTHYRCGVQESRLRALLEPDVSLATHPPPTVQPQQQASSAEAGPFPQPEPLQPIPCPRRMALRPLYSRCAQRTTSSSTHAQHLVEG